MSILGFRPHKREVKEAHVQDSVVRYARERYPDKLIAKKNQAGKFGSNGWPDYEFLIYKDCFFIEFKKPGGLCTDLQLQCHAKLRALGHRVYVCENAQTGKGIIDNEMKWGESRRRRA